MQIRNLESCIIDDEEDRICGRFLEMLQEQWSPNVSPCNKYQQDCIEIVDSRHQEVQQDGLQLKSNFLDYYSWVRSTDFLMLTANIVAVAQTHSHKDDGNEAVNGTRLDDRVRAASAWCYYFSTVTAVTASGRPPMLDEQRVTVLLLIRMDSWELNLPY